MAARNGQLTETKLDEMRRRIKCTLLLKKLEDHALGGEEMTQTQIRAAEIVLKKAVPDVSSVTISGDPENPLRSVTRIELAPLK